MTIRTALSESAVEKSTYRITATITDESGAALPAASLATLVLTLYALDAALTIVNGVTAANILNTGRGAVDAAGKLTLTLLPADNVLIDPTQGSEIHVALVEWTWAAGLKAGKHEVQFTVVNLAKVP
jgi:hypothetical protein